MLCGRDGTPPPVWMFVGALFSVAASHACPNPPCRDRLVAALPLRPGGETGPGSGICEGHAGVKGCRTVVPLPAAHSNHPSRLEHRVADSVQIRPKMIPTAGDVKERVVRLQRCMHSVQDTGPHWSQGQAQDGDSLGAILALMAAVLTEGSSIAPLARFHPQDCAEIYKLGIVENGIYTIQPDLHRPALEAKCDMETTGGGWTVFQRRQDGSLDFNRTWQEYTEGFGSAQAGELWLGNAALHALTSGGQHQLRMELEDWHQQRRQATYSIFKVASEAQRYRLTAREYSGDAGNALSYSKRYNHDGRSFSTADRDHDRYATGNCAQYYGAGWWFDACLAANLNGRYYRGRYSGLTNGIYWGTWYMLTDGRTGERFSFKSVEMKTRPRGSGSRLT
ncbi:hypothetical protein NHX12_031114 [Muraenolepis orangiensis]|uniref:Fibrinogen C-terminal domain-containing protein n=1 Tax=Muraenolepis orangiensis TaxID=630683 RepID=A0A9Q0IK06_9TELE|nr:hypothetical protein NHX12_031114 [Muraenolepis orangiensis]